MAPKRQAALAAQANMAAVAAREVSAESPVKAHKTSKIVKSSDVKASGKTSGTKVASVKSSEAKAPSAPPIPLVCVVCPSQPRFSDVSHLLTHLSSKGHLHTLNDTKIRSHADLSAAQTIATYEKWYKDNGLERMLAERLMAKDEKVKGPYRGKRPGQPFSQTLKRKKALPVLVKPEPGNDPTWTPSPTGHILERQEAISFYGDYDETSVTTPTDDAIEWTPDDPEATRLKGTVWPGMGLFDAATPDQKKKRNQRKDASVLHQMMISSQAITTTELVANLDLEIERTRDIYDAPSIEGTPPAKKPRRRQKRSRVVEDDDDNGSEIVVKIEHHEEPLKRATHARAARSKKATRKHDKGLEPDPNADFVSEKLDVTSDAPNSADVDVDADIEDSQLGDESSLSNYNSLHHFTLPDEHDVFRDSNRGISAPQKFSKEILDEARFDIRNRIPLQSMNPNSNLSLASPTPAAKQLPHRTFKGNENNRGFQGQGMGGGHYLYGSANNHLNQGGLANPNTSNPFNGFHQPQDMFYNQNYQSPWLPPVSHAQTHGFNPINGTPNQQLFFGNQMLPMAANAFSANENDQGQGMGMFGEGV